MVYFNQTTIHKKILKTELILQNNQVTVKKKQVLVLFILEIPISSVILCNNCQLELPKP